MSETLEKLQGWAEGLSGQAREAANTVVEFAKRTNARIDFNEDGKPDLNQLAQGATEGVKNAASYLSEQGLALYEKLPEGVQNVAEQAGEFASNNRMGIGGFLLAMILGMGLFEMGPLGALLLGVLAFAAGNLLGDNKNSLLGGLLNPSQGQGQAPQREQGAGQTHEQGQEQGAGQGQGQAPAGEPLSSTVQVIRDGKFIGTNERGERVFGTQPSEVTFVQPGADGKPAYQITGTVSGLGGRLNEFNITEISAVLLDGTVVPPVEGYNFERVTIDSRGYVDLASPTFNSARERAARAAENYTAPTELAVSRDPADPTRVAVTLGTTRIEGKDYTVELRGSAVGPYAQFNEAVLMDGGTLVTDSNGQPIVLEFNPPQNYVIKNDKIRPMSGNVARMTANIGNTVIGEQRRELAATNQAREADRNQFVSSIETHADDQAAAVSALRETYRQRMADRGVDGMAAALAASAITDQYEKPEFRGLSPEDAAARIAALPEVKSLGSDYASQLQADVKLLHTDTSRVLTSASPVPTETTEVASVSPPSVPGRGRGVELA